MTKEWFKHMPPNGVLCKCKKGKNGRDIIDVITRYNDILFSDNRFRSNNDWYTDATPLTLEEAMTFLYDEVSNE